MLLTEYTIWLGLVCLAIAFGCSWWLYKSNPLNIEGKFKPYIIGLIHVLRFSSVFIISLLLLGPLLKLVTQNIEKPVLIYAIDNSQSLTIAHDSAALTTKLQTHINQLSAQLKSNYTIVPYLVGSNTQTGNNINFTSKKTNLSNLFDVVKNSYDAKQIGGIILATDGIYTDGENPVNAAQQLNAPIYAIALGDTNQRKDVLVKQVRTNQLVFAGNTFPAEVDVAAFGVKNETSLLSITQNGKKVFEKPVTINGNYFNTQTIQLTAEKSGTMHLVVQLSAVKGEATLTNNRFDVFVQIIENKQKIALVGYTPHPDLSAWQSILKQNENYSVNTFIISQQQTPVELEKYSLVIFNQLPGINGEGLNLIKQCKEKGISQFYIVGAQTNIPYFINAQTDLQILGNKGIANEVLPVLNSSFSLFNMSADEQQHITRFPPLLSQFGNYKINSAAEILFTQQIGYVKTAYPLLFFTKDATAQSGFFCAEGFWKWRMYDKAISNMQTTTTIVNGIVQYLAGKKNQSRFRVNNKKIYAEDEPVEFDAELYNQSYQLTNGPEVNMLITNQAGKQFNYTFSKAALAYKLTIDAMPAGKYLFTATVNGGAQKISGRFIVKQTQAEFIQTTANHQMLNQLATQSGGSLVYLNAIDGLANTIEKNPQNKPVIYTTNELKKWIDLKWLFWLLLAFLSIEWFIRKWNGVI